MEILSTEVVSEFTFFGGVVAIISAIFLIVGILVLIHGIVELSIGTAAIGSASILLAITCMYLANTKLSVNHEEHKVIIEDYAEFHQDAYEIIDVEGQILTIKKKEDDE
jgi:hypothetical protein